MSFCNKSSKSCLKSRVCERVSFASHQASPAIEASQAKQLSREISVFFKKSMLKKKIKRNVVLQQKLKSCSKSRVSERASFASHQASQAIQASQAKLVSREISVFFEKSML